MEITRELKAKGIVVIPKDIRKQINLQTGDELNFRAKDNKIIIEKKKRDVDNFLKEFFKYRKKGKGFTLKELKKIEEEGYDLP